MKRFRPTLAQFKEVSNKLHEMDVKYLDAIDDLSEAKTNQKANYEWACDVEEKLMECKMMRDLYFRLIGWVTIGFLATIVAERYVSSVS